MGINWKKSSRKEIIDNISEAGINDNILHIHIPKCGGIWAKSILYCCDGITHRFNHGHSIAAAIKDYLEDQGYNWDDFYKCTIVRDPWSKIWSGYKFTKWGGDFHQKNKLHYINRQVFNPIRDESIDLLEDSNTKVFEGYGMNNNLGETFKEYVDSLYKIYKEDKLGQDVEPGDLTKILKSLPLNIYITPQWRFLTDIDNESLLVDKVFKINEMDKLFDWARNINGDHGIVLRSKFQSRVNVSENRIHHYNVYDDEMINKIGEIYQKDIDLFNLEY